MFWEYSSGSRLRARKYRVAISINGLTKHFGAFALLVFFLLRALRFEFPAAANGRLVGASIVGSSLIGALLEFWQLLFPYRSAEVADWVADTLGALSELIKEGKVREIGCSNFSGEQLREAEDRKSVV